MTNQNPMPEFMYDLDKHLEKLLYAQHMLVDALRNSKKHLSLMTWGECNDILAQFAERSQWTASLEEQLEWAQSNQDTITHFGNSVEELSEGFDE